MYHLLFFLVFIIVSPLAVGENAINHAPSSPHAFLEWLETIKKKAQEKGISKKTLQKAFHNFRSPLENVIKTDRNQPEFITTFDTYYEKRVPGLTPKGQKLMKKHQGLLRKISKKYGVPPAIMMALWGMETHYGKLACKIPAVHALATLAYDGRRMEFFTQELFHALHILEEKHIEPHKMMGSWAGAIGQCQFMPSTFRNHAVDETGKGRKDIWHTLPDVLGSMANYLKKSGWKTHEPCVYEVILPDNFLNCSETINENEVKSLEEWQKLGVERKNKAPFLNPALKASLVRPKKTTRAFLVFENIHVILKWNRSLNFALSVGLLANNIHSSEL